MSEEAIQRANFITASKELGCEVAKNPKLALETTESKAKLKEIFTKNDLPIDNDEDMLAIFDKFSEDQTIKEEVKAYINEECKVETQVEPATDTPATETPATPAK